MADQNQSDKKSKYSVVLIVVGVNDGQQKVTLRAILLDAAGKPVPGKEILFHVNKEQQVGSFVTDNNGAATLEFNVAPGTTTLTAKATAVVEGKPSSGDSVVNLVGISLPKPLKYDYEEVFAEQVKHADGNFTYYLAILNSMNYQPVADELIIMPKKKILFNGETKEGAFRFPIGESGEIVTIFTDDPGHLEIDLIPKRFPKNHKQIDIYGPSRVPINADKDSPVLVRLFDGCV